MSTSILPDTKRLTAALGTIFSSENGTNAKVKILAREDAIYASTAPSEIVTCLLGYDTELRLFCKYGGYSSYSHGSRGGVTYEAEVYHQVLQSLRISKATFYGAYKDAITGETWLILEYLNECLQLNKAPQPDAILLAANWLGRFHAIYDASLSMTSIPFVKIYDADYYLGWSYRTSLFAGELHSNFPWLETLCKNWEEIIEELLLSPTTVIHGEFYPKNILIHDMIVYPVDWESAAIAVGEIDLAALTDDWPEEIVQQCELEYQRARWEEGKQDDFLRRLDAARLYREFRWLGDRPERTTSKNLLPRFEKLHSIGERLGLI